MAERFIVGCMTGTSIDAVDAALVRVEGAGLSMRASVVRGASVPLGEALERGLRACASQSPMSAGEMAELSRALSQRHAEAVRAAAEHDRVDLVCVHGQTVYHKPPISWQMFSPAVLAREVNAPIVFDLRAADLASGGQGAPITPIADYVLLGRTDGPVSAVNLGGFCNVTLLPTKTGAAGEADAIRGFDVCACNQLLDEVARRVLYVPFDAGGAAAMSGTPHDEALEDLLGVLEASARARRSLGTGDEAAEWVSRWRAHVPPADLCATACAGVGEAIANAVISRAVEPPRAVYLAGGGVRNAALVSAIASASTAPVTTTASAGLAPELREAACFAVLGALCEDRVPITLPQVTGGAAGVVSGFWVRP